MLVELKKYGLEMVGDEKEEQTLRRVGAAETGAMNVSKLDERSALEKEIGETERKLNTQMVIVRGLENTITYRKGIVPRMRYAPLFDNQSARLDADLAAARAKLDHIRAELSELYARRGK